MEIVKAFNDNNLHTDILIKGTVNEPLFRASDIGEILEITNIRSNIKDFDNTERHVDTIYTSTGPKQVTFLTEKGLYKVLFKSRKPIAEKFQNWVCEVIKEIRLNGIYDLKKQLENQHNAIKQKMDEQKELDKEKYLLKQFGNIKNIVYIIKVKTYDNGTYVIKIGHSTKGIYNRYNEHKTNYDECLLLDCFSADKARDFESFLHRSQEVSSNKVTNLQGHERENELFLIGTTLTYQTLLKIINDNINNYNYTVNELLLENELLKQKLSNNENNKSNPDNDLTELKDIIKQLSNEIVNLKHSNQQILNKLNSQDTKLLTGFNQQMPHLGPRLQKINPETLQLVKVYESVSEIMNENKDIKRPSIMKAIKENTVYCGFRWLLVERNLDANIIHDIQQTKQTKTQNLGYIAKLNHSKTEILNVYLDRKTAASLNGYKSLSSFENIVKNSSLTNGHYYILYDNCEQELIDYFESINGAPLLYKNGIGQYDLHGSFIREFACKYDCIRGLKISDKSLAKALINNIPYNNYYYKELGSKLKMK